MAWQNMARHWRSVCSQNQSKSSTQSLAGCQNMHHDLCFYQTGVPILSSFPLNFGRFTVARQDATGVDASHPTAPRPSSFPLNPRIRTGDPEE